MNKLQKETTRLLGISIHRPPCYPSPWIFYSSFLNISTVQTSPKYASLTKSAVLAHRMSSIAIYELLATIKFVKPLPSQPTLPDGFDGSIYLLSV
jgi:hypothetical protein